MIKFIIFLLDVFLCVMGFLSIKDPALIWEFEHCFTVAKGEPTEFALKCIRLSGIFYLILAIGGVAALFLI